MELSKEDIRDLLESKVAFIERTGVKALILEKGRIKLSAPLAGNENHIGTMYAGALFTLAEVPGGALFLTSFDVTRFYPVVKEMKIRFRRPAATDVTIEMMMAEEEVGRIQEEAEESGKSEFVLTGEVKDEKGEVVAISEGVYQIRKA